MAAATPEPSRARLLTTAALLSAAALLLGSPAAAAQVVVEEYEPAAGTLRIGPEPEEVIPRTDRGYTLILPEGDAAPRGLVVFLDGHRVSVAPGPPPEESFDHAALWRGLGILRLTTGNPLDFFFDEATLRDAVRRLEAILAAHALEGVPIVVAGLSLGGTRALRLTVFLEQQPEEFTIRPAAVAVIDAPLDMTRLWAAEREAVVADFHIDLAGLVNQLRLLGNDGAELITTTASREGYEDGTTPHTWSIVDDGELVEWFLAALPEKR